MEYGGSEDHQYRVDEAWYIIIRFDALFIYCLYFSTFLFACACVVVFLTKEQIIFIIAILRKMF